MRRSLRKGPIVSPEGNITFRGGFFNFRLYVCAIHTILVIFTFWFFSNYSLDPAALG